MFKDLKKFIKNIRKKLVLRPLKFSKKNIKKISVKTLENSPKNPLLKTFKNCQQKYFKKER